MHNRGVIILASQVPDQNGTNPKDRPVLLLVDFTDTDTEALTSPSVAVCDWPVVVGKADILGKLGSCPSLQFAAVLAQLPKLQPPPIYQHTPNAPGSAGS